MPSRRSTQPMFEFPREGNYSLAGPAGGREQERNATAAANSDAPVSQTRRPAPS